MNPLDLPFNTDDMIAGLRPWIECESPTYDAAAVNRMMDIAAHDMAILGAQIDRIPGRMGFGESVRARFPHPDMGRVPGILIAGHMDTVHPIGTLDVLPFKREGDICYGPGLMDMKGGNYISLDAIRQMIRAGLQTPLPVTVLFTPDEEVGTPSTRDLIEQEAARNKYVLVPEPGHEDGGVTIGRYAIARFNLRTIGQPSHAGARLGDGKSAIAAMARKIGEIENMSSPNCTFSVGVIHAGQWVNCVSSFCDAQALTMAKKQENLDDGVARMMALQGEVNGVVFEVERGVTRPVWRPDQLGTRAVFNIAKDLAQELGFKMKGRSQGGGSDANFTGAMGIASLDSLGVLGDGLHTLNEHIFVDSLAQRARLMAGLLNRLS